MFVVEFLLRLVRHPPGLVAPDMRSIGRSGLRLVLPILSFACGDCERLHSKGFERLLHGRDARTFHRADALGFSLREGMSERYRNASSGLTIKAIFGGVWAIWSGSSSSLWRRSSMDSVVGVTSFGSAEADGCQFKGIGRGNTGIGRSSCSSGSPRETSPLTMVWTGSHIVIGTCVVEVSCPATSSTIGPGSSGEAYGTKGNVEDIGVEEKTDCYREHKGVQRRTLMVSCSLGVAYRAHSLIRVR